MNLSGKGREARGDGEEARPQPVSLLAWRLLPVACSCAALGVVCFGLLQLDLPITRYVRSVTIHLPWDQLTVPWMAFTSDAGDWIGQGWRLIGVSVALLALGWSLSKARMVRAGTDTLIAHGLAALVSNGLKHLLGRPRPKFVHSGEWQLAPSWTSGLDSFPSGHTTAAFAVATVLARRFPAFAPLALGIAAFVGLSRVLRGSHFPTDVFGGAVVGIVTGSLVAAPWKQWRTSLQEGLFHAGLGTACAFSLLWVLSHPAQEGAAETLFMGFGLLALVAGVWLRGKTWVGTDHVTTSREKKNALSLIAYGLACLTASPLIVSSVGLMCAAAWFRERGGDENQRSESCTFRAIQDSAIALGVLLVLAILVAARGSLPFR
jgi:undecaprenyl-diphosphatase